MVGESKTKTKTETMTETESAMCGCGCVCWGLKNWGIRDFGNLVAKLCLSLRSRRGSKTRAHVDERMLALLLEYFA